MESVPSKTFHYQEVTIHPLRTVQHNEETWFLASDVCEMLDITNVSDAVGRLEEYEKGIVTTDTPGGKQPMLCVNELGLYSLIFTSRKPEAKAFKKWVTTEVLPTIRKTGNYSLNGQKLLQPTSTQNDLTQEEQQSLILRYVEKLDNPTARDMSAYLKRFSVSEIRFQLHDMAIQGKLEEQPIRTNSHRYKVK